jgi:hypothetical protein
MLDEFSYKLLGIRLIYIGFGFLKNPRTSIKRLSYRAYQVAYNLRYGDIPWLTQEANSILLGTLRPWMKGFEWGSGKSTLFFSKRVSFLVSIEHDYYWYRLVRSWLDREHINNCDLRFINSPQRYVGTHLKIPYLNIECIVVIFLDLKFVWGLKSHLRPAKHPTQYKLN